MRTEHEALENLYEEHNRVLLRVVTRRRDRLKESERRYERKLAKELSELPQYQKRERPRHFKRYSVKF